MNIEWMYFVILGKNKKISMKELSVLKPYNEFFLTEDFLIFNTDFPDFLYKLWGIVKWWKIVNFDFIESLVTEKKISLIWVNDKQIWIYFKKSISFIKRFKFIEYKKTDLDIKNKWIEIFSFPKQENVFGLVYAYQDIDFYQKIDFDKPVRSMNIGMMPSKLAHIMINLWLRYLENKKTSMTVYDPFIGSGTLGFMANYLWYDFIGSDINTSPVKQNLKWWDSFYKWDKRFTVFKHNVENNFKNMILKGVDLIVTEWRLWPVIKNDFSNNDFLKEVENIKYVYKSFLQNVDKFFENIVVVFTVPVYKWEYDYISDSLEKMMDFMNWESEVIEELYMRKGQNVARKIICWKK